LEVFVVDACPTHSKQKRGILFFIGIIIGTKKISNVFRRIAGGLPSRVQELIL